MIGQLLSGAVDAPPCKDVAKWWARYRDLGASSSGQFGRGLAGGFAADRIAWAFTSGYQAALHALFVVAAHARAMRTERAWQKLAEPRNAGRLPAT
jgi:hypothetical protein